jgi:hypothetical protein
MPLKPEALGRGEAAILTGCVSLLFCGCANEHAVWSTEIRSSNRNLRAVAESFVRTGPAANSLVTGVRIERDGRSSFVLGVNDGGKGLLTMKWLTPHHLLIVVRDDPDYVYYQAIRASGVDISLRYERRPKQSNAQTKHTRPQS